MPQPLRDLATPLAVLELIATDQPNLLEYTVKTMLRSPAKRVLANLAHEWGVELDELAGTVTAAARGLDALERRRGGWQQPQEILGAESDAPVPNTAALWRLAVARAYRVHSVRRQRLVRMACKLRQVHESERTKAWITSFLAADRSGDGLRSHRPPPNRDGSRHV